LSKEKGVCENVMTGDNNGYIISNKSSNYYAKGEYGPWESSL
jgi:hypothetical protein